MDVSFCPGSGTSSVIKGQAHKTGVCQGERVYKQSYKEPHDAFSEAPRDPGLYLEPDQQGRPVRPSEPVLSEFWDFLLPRR